MWKLLMIAMKIEKSEKKKGNNTICGQGEKTVLKEWESLDHLMLASNMVTKLKYCLF